MFDDVSTAAGHCVRREFGIDLFQRVHGAKVEAIGRALRRRTTIHLLHEESVQRLLRVERCKEHVLRRDIEGHDSLLFLLDRRERRDFPRRFRHLGTFDPAERPNVIEKRHAVFDLPCELVEPAEEPPADGESCDVGVFGQGEALRDVTSGLSRYRRRTGSLDVQVVVGHDEAAGIECPGPSRSCRSRIWRQRARGLSE